MWEIWANKLLPKALKSGPKNCPIWSHCPRVINDYHLAEVGICFDTGLPEIVKNLDSLSLTSFVTLPNAQTFENSG